MPDVTTIYYFFSTLAQTLASVIAILAAFATVRLSDISRRLEGELRPLRRHAQYAVVFDSALAEGEFAIAIGELEKYDLDNDDDQLMLDICRRIERERVQLVSALGGSLLTTGVVILLSVLALAIANWLSLTAWVAWSALCIGSLGLLLSLATAGVLISRLQSTASRSRRRSKRPRIRTKA